MGEQVLIARCGGRVVFEKSPVTSRWTGEVEERRRDFVEKASNVLTAVILGTLYSFKLGSSTVDAATRLMAPHTVSSADKIREGFMKLVDVFTAISEPILWFYALTACILMATGKNKEAGWTRLKNVGYAYIFISLLPAFFTFLRWVAKLVGDAIQLS